MRQRLSRVCRRADCASAFPNSGRNSVGSSITCRPAALSCSRARIVYSAIALRRSARCACALSGVSAARSAASKSALEVELSTAMIHLMPRRFFSASAVSSASRSAISSGLTVIATPNRAPSMRNECTPEARRLSVPTGAIPLTPSATDRNSSALPGRRSIDDDVVILQRGVSRHDAQALQHQKRFETRKRCRHVAEGSALQHPARDRFDRYDALDEGLEFGVRAERDAIEVVGDLEAAVAPSPLRELSRRSADRRRSRSASVVGTASRQRNAIAAATVLLPVPPLPVTKISRGRVI